MDHFKNVNFPAIQIRLIETPTEIDSNAAQAFFTQMPQIHLENLFTEQTMSNNILQQSVYGIFENEALIGLINWFEDYPTKSIGTIEHFVLAPEYKETALAAQLYQALEKTAQDTGMTSIQCRYLKDHMIEEDFWTQQEFTSLNQTTDGLILEKNL